MKYLLSAFLFVILGAFTILSAMGTYVFLGYSLGMTVVHIGIWKKKVFPILLGVILIILSFFLPNLLYYGFGLSFHIF
ncbi:hypothetical protein [Thalassobacillus pellis]|uniref:hypothetical protein n=1 Tax=Thalassobacillus pellis TaxID=748008 RepID=UPI00196109CC|nr:hypothetical protein [Thalassobacillus pellis]MBM7553270.1 hypothetical protein [Thalassobacillus pellis]